MSDNTPQQIINLGSAPNSGTGEDLRAAFAAVNNNFANVWAAGPVDTQVTITNNWVSTTETDLDLVIAGNGLGNIQMQTTALTQDIRPLSTGVYDLGSANLQYNSGWIRYQNVETLVASGNIEANYFIGNGSQLTGIAGGNADLGNWAFTGNQIYNINGGSINNGDLSHGATSGLTIPLNSGNLSDLNLTNIYGNIVVLTGNGPSADQYWQFDRAGNLVFPGGAILGNTYGDDGNNIALQPGANGYALLNSADQRQYIQVDNNAIYVGTDYPAHNYTWTFGTDGNLTLPSNSANINYANGVSILDGIDANTGNIRFNNTSIYSVDNADILIDPSNDDGNTGYILVPGPSNANTTALTIENQLAGNVVIRSNDNTWTFNSNGNLTLPSNTASINYANGNPYGSGAGGIQSQIANGTSNVNIATSGGAVTIKAGFANAWMFGTDSTLTAPNESQIVPAGNNFNLYTYGVNGAVQFFTDVTGNNHNWAFDGYGYTNLPFSQGYSNTAVITTVGAGNIMLQAGAGPTQNFLFGSDGNLNTPSGMVINSDIIGANVVSANTFVSNAFNVVTAGNLSITSQYGLGFTGTILEDNGTLELIANGAGGVYVGWDSLYGNGLGNIATVSFNEVNGGEGNIWLRTGNRSATEYIWNFDNTGVLTLPGEGVLRSVGDSVTLQSYNVGTGNVQSVYLGSGGGLGFFDQDIGGNWLEIFRSGAEPQIRVPVGRGNLNFQTAEGINAYDWVFDNTGILTAPGPITTSGTVITTPVALASLTAVAGARAFINDGNLVAAGNFGQQVGGSGSNTVPVWSDGTNWYIG